MSVVIGEDYIKPNDKDVALAEEVAKAWLEGRCPQIRGSSLASVHSNPQYVLAGYIEYALTTIRREEREIAWRDAAQKLRTKAEEWREQAERWQRNAEGAGMDIIREQDYADRDVCLSKMAAAMTLAIEFDEAAADTKGEG